MPFQEKSKAYTYIDISAATPADRLKITFENGMEVYFQTPPATNSPYRDYRLDVDSELTSPAVLAELHELILAHERFQESHRLPFLRKRWKIEEIRQEARIQLEVKISRFGQSPRVGQPLRVWGLIDHGGTIYWVAGQSLVAKVESITVD